MIVVRFKMQSRPDKVDVVRALLTEVAMAIATEVFDDREALDRQESLPEVAAAMAAFEEALAAEPEATIFNVASAEPYE